MKLLERLLTETHDAEYLLFVLTVILHFELQIIHIIVTKSAHVAS